MIRTTFHWLNALAVAVRSWQQDALREMQALDTAVASNMAHGAMAGHDPLTDSLLDQAAAACAQEGAHPATTAGAGLTAAQLAALADTQADDWWLDWLVPAVLTVLVLAYAAHLAGWN